MIQKIERETKQLGEEPGSAPEMCLTDTWDTSA